MADIVAPDTMTKEMDDALDGNLKKKDPEKHYHALHDAIATVLSLAFLMWLPSQQVMLVLGKGPDPDLRAAVRAGGTGGGGDTLPMPGHLMA